MICVCGHAHSDHDMLASTSCRMDHCGCPRWGIDDMAFARAPQSIPVVTEQTARLVALFEAALAATPYDITLSETNQPGAGIALIAWAKSRGLRVQERRFVTETDAYANIKVRLSADSTITALNYRKLTADEIAAITVETRERKPERIGYGDAQL